MNRIVIPLSSCGGALGNDTELRYALRSIEAYFTDPFEIVIVGSRLPGWLQNVTYLHCVNGLKTALKVAADNYPEGFFWFYDDCCILKPTSAEEMRRTPQCDKFSDNSTTKWQSSLVEIKKRLTSEGYTPKDFSRPHGPYWFDKSMVDEAFNDWPEMSGKFPFETWILSKRGHIGDTSPVKHYYGKFNSPPSGHRYVNYSDAGNTPALRNWLDERFPRPSKFEPDSASAFFFHIAGNGGSAILSAAGSKLSSTDCWKTLPWDNEALQKRWKKSGKLPVVTLIADPITRAISAYKEIAKTPYSEADPHYVVLRAMIRAMTFSEFWERVDVKSLLRAIPHFTPQTTLLQHAPVDLLLRREHLHRELPKLSEMLGVDMTSVVIHSEFDDVVVSEKAKNKIVSIYESDVRFFYPDLNQ